MVEEKSFWQKPIGKFVSTIIVIIGYMLVEIIAYGLWYDICISNGESVEMVLEKIMYIKYITLFMGIMTLMSICFD